MGNIGADLLLERGDFCASTSIVAKITKNRNYCAAYPKEWVGFRDALNFSMGRRL